VLIQDGGIKVDEIQDNEVLKLRQQVRSLEELLNSLEIRFKTRDKQLEIVSLRITELTERFIKHEFDKERHKAIEQPNWEEEY
jgi:predicted enzyme involved in methoxymalonyl-ACP biosynthesis